MQFSKFARSWAFLAASAGAGSKTGPSYFEVTDLSQKKKSFFGCGDIHALVKMLTEAAKQIEIIRIPTHIVVKAAKIGWFGHIEKGEYFWKIWG